MGSYVRSKEYYNEEGRKVTATMTLSRSTDTCLYYRDEELIFSMETTELENFIAMALSTGYIDIKEL